MSITHIDVGALAPVIGTTGILGPTISVTDGAYTAHAPAWCAAYDKCAEDVNPATNRCWAGHDQAAERRRLDALDNPMVLLADKRDGSVTVLQWGAL